MLILFCSVKQSLAASMEHHGADETMGMVFELIFIQGNDQKGKYLYSTVTV